MRSEHKVSFHNNYENLFEYKQDVKMYSIEKQSPEQKRLNKIIMHK